MTSGIRQGCTVSTTLFKLITLKIMQQIQDLNKGYRDEEFNITYLFFADHGMLLTSSVEDTKHVIKKMEEIGKEFGLEINKEKSRIIIFNMKVRPENIENKEAKDRFRYF